MSGGGSDQGQDAGSALNSGADTKGTPDDPNDPDNKKAGPPDKPQGSLKKPSDSYLKDKGVDPHELKDRIGDSRLDIYVDKKGNIWTLPKEGRGVAPEWQGNLKDFAGPK
jgi:hypothetical protein